MPQMSCGDRAAVQFICLQNTLRLQGQTNKRMKKMSEQYLHYASLGGGLAFQGLLMFCCATWEFKWSQTVIKN